VNEPLVNTFGPLDGAEIPGGCMHCDALQKVRREGPGVWVLDIFHDDDGPVLQAMEAKRK